MLGWALIGQLGPGCEVSPSMVTTQAGLGSSRTPPAAPEEGQEAADQHPPQPEGQMGKNPGAPNPPQALDGCTPLAGRPDWAWSTGTGP